MVIEFLLLMRTRVQCPTLMSRGPQTPGTPAPRDPMTSLDLFLGACTENTHTFTGMNEYTHINKPFLKML